LENLEFIGVHQEENLELIGVHQEENLELYDHESLSATTHAMLKKIHEKEYYYGNNIKTALDDLQAN
jgi:hypothetical protein